MAEMGSNWTPHTLCYVLPFFTLGEVELGAYSVSAEVRQLGSALMHIHSVHWTSSPHPCSGDDDTDFIKLLMSIQCVIGT